MLCTGGAPMSYESDLMDFCAHDVRFRLVPLPARCIWFTLAAHERGHHNPAGWDWRSWSIETLARAVAALPGETQEAIDALLGVGLMDIHSDGRLSLLDFRATRSVRSKRGRRESKPESKPESEPESEPESKLESKTQGAGNSLASSAEKPATFISEKRAEASRINGLKGGRPKKQRTTGGNVSVISDCQNAGALGFEAPSGSTAKEYTSYKLKLVAVANDKPKNLGRIPKEEAQRLGRLASQAARLSGQHPGAVYTWLRAGATEETILRVIEGKMLKGYAPRNLGAFTAAIVAAAENSEAGGADDKAVNDAEPSPVATDQASNAGEPSPTATDKAASAHWLRDLEKWRDNGCPDGYAPGRRADYIRWYAEGRPGNPPLYAFALRERQQLHDAATASERRAA